MKLMRSIATGIAALALALPVAAGHHEGGEAGAKGRQKAHEVKEKAAATRGAAEAEADAQDEAMRARRDERKAIMEEAKASTEPSERKGKKPWWKFWGSDEE